MSKLPAVILFSCMLITGQAFCQADPSSAIIDAFRKGNSSELGKYFNEMVDLNIPGFKDSYSKTQAERIIKDFFSNNPVAEVSVNRDGNYPDGSKYTMGSMTIAGKKYSLFFLLRKSNGEYRIHQLNFQSE